MNIKYRIDQYKVLSLSNKQEILTGLHKIKSAITCINQYSSQFAFYFIIQISQKMSSILSPSTNLNLTSSNPQPHQPTTQKQCRICLQQTLPMIIACNCIGTVKYVHEQCLKQWAIQVIKRKLKEQEDDGMEEVIDGIQCELCKQNICLKLEWTDRRLGFDQARLRNEQYFWSMFAINVFIILICLGCILFTLVTIIMVLAKNPKVDYQKFLDQPFLSWGTLSVALASGIIFIIKSTKDLYAMFIRREFHIDGVIAKERIGQEELYKHGDLYQNIEFNMNKIKSISDFKVNVQASESDLNKGFSSRSKKVIPTLQIQPDTNQQFVVPNGSKAGLKHLDSLPALSKFVPTS